MIRITDPAQIGPAIVDLRTMYGLRQRDLAEQTGFSQGTVSAYELAGKVPSPQSLLKLLGVMGLGLAIVPLDDTEDAIDPRWDRVIAAVTEQIRRAVREGA